MERSLGRHIFGERTNAEDMVLEKVVALTTSNEGETNTSTWGNKREKDNLLFSTYELYF